MSTAVVQNSRNVIFCVIFFHHLFFRPHIFGKKKCRICTGLFGSHVRMKLFSIYNLLCVGKSVRQLSRQRILFA